MCNEMCEEMSMPQLLDLLTQAEEFAELPVRHNEDELNEVFAKASHPERVDERICTRRVLIYSCTTALPFVPVCRSVLCNPNLPAGIRHTSRLFFCCRRILGGCRFRLPTMAPTQSRFLTSACASCNR